MEGKTLIESTFKIGRVSDNNIVISKPDISGHHAAIVCLSENSFLLEDYNSSNGTFINGYRIKRAVCSRNDSVFIADQKLDFNYYFPLKEIKKEVQEKFNIPEQKVEVANAKDPNDLTEEFIKLEAIYKTYTEIKASISGQGQLKMGVLRAVPGAALSLLLGVIFPYFGLLHVLGTYGSTVGSSLGSMIGIGISQKISPTEKLAALDDEFKINYVCPKCKNFLGFVPWKGLTQIGKHGCGAIWVK